MSEPTAQALLEQVRQFDESDRIEAKRASSIGESLLETVCALANEPGLGGGWLLLGVEKISGVPGDYRVSGIEDPDKMLNDLHSQCANAFNVPLRVQARAEALYEADDGVFADVSGGPEGLSREFHSLSRESDGLSVESESLSRESLLAALPPSARRQVEALGQRSRDTGRLKSAILTLCALRPWSLRELAIATGRNAAYLQHQYLTPLKPRRRPPPRPLIL